MEDLNTVTNPSKSIKSWSAFYCHQAPAVLHNLVSDKILLPVCPPATSQSPGSLTELASARSNESLKVSFQCFIFQNIQFIYIFFFHNCNFVYLFQNL